MSLIKIEIKRNILHFHSNFSLPSIFFFKQQNKQTAPEAPGDLTVEIYVNNVTVKWTPPSKTPETLIRGYYINCNGTDNSGKYILCWYKIIPHMFYLVFI